MTLPLAFVALLATAADPLLARATALHKRAIVVDTHSDTTSRMLDGVDPWAKWGPEFEIGTRARDGHMDLPRMREGGLDALGGDVVREMNRIGMVVDVSHVSDEAFFAVLDSSTAPAMASHSSCRALCNHKRNMSDEMIRALAAKGGVIQINFNSGFLDQGFLDAASALRATLAADAKARYADQPAALKQELARIDYAVPSTPPPLAKLVDHIDHAVKLVGADHVGLGSDFDGVPSVPAGMEDCSKLPSLTYELLKRGYSDADVLKILGGNTLRVLEAVEAEARKAR